MWTQIHFFWLQNQRAQKTLLAFGSFGFREQKYSYLLARKRHKNLGWRVGLYGGVVPATVAHQQNQHQLSLTMKQHRFARNPSMVWHTKKSHRFGLELPFEFSSTAASHRPQAHQAPSRVLSEALWLLHLLLCLPRNRNMLQIKAAAPKLFIHHNDDMVGLHLRRKLGRSQAREIGAGPGLAIGKSRTVYIRSNDETGCFCFCCRRGLLSLLSTEGVHIMLPLFELVCTRLLQRKKCG